MFSNLKNRGKLISFFIALTLVLITTFFVNSNKKEVEKISGKIAGIDKKMEASLSNYLLAKSDFSQAMLYNTLGLKHMENGHSFQFFFLPFKDAVINGIRGLNEAIGAGGDRVDEGTVKSLTDAFQTAASHNDIDSFLKTFFKAQQIINKLNKAYENEINQLGEQKLGLKNERAALDVKASLLTWIAAIIGFIQLFFNSFYDMYMEYKKSKLPTTIKA